MCLSAVSDCIKQLMVSLYRRFEDGRNVTEDPSHAPQPGPEFAAGRQSRCGMGGKPCIKVSFFHSLSMVVMRWTNALLTSSE